MAELGVMIGDGRAETGAGDNSGTNTADPITAGPTLLYISPDTSSRTEADLAMFPATFAGFIGLAGKAVEGFGIQK